MTMATAREKGFDCHFLCNAVEAEGFAAHLAKVTGREVLHFTETVNGFPLFIAAVAARPRPKVTNV
jgi:hypothetical protein